MLESTWKFKKTTASQVGKFPISIQSLQSHSAQNHEGSSPVVSSCNRFDTSIPFTEALNF